MKKFLILGGFFLAAVGLAAAQDIDSKVKDAVGGLAARLNQIYEVSIGPVTLAGTDMASGLSRLLDNRIAAHAPRVSTFRVVPLSRGVSRLASPVPKAIIQGSFFQEGDIIRVTLQLVSDSDGVIIDTRDFTIPAAELQKLNIDILPGNIKTGEEAKEREAMFVPSPAQAVQPVQPANADSFTITAWPDSDTATYFDGDELKISMEAGRGCYVKVYHINVDGRMQLLYPYQENQNNFLAANTVKTIPEAPARLVCQAPFGVEQIWVVASLAPFDMNQMKEEFGKVRRVSAEEIQKTRGIILTMDTKTETVVSAETRFSLTILPNDYADETLTYKPVNMSEAIEALRGEARRQGGTFTGEEQGSFSYAGTQGSYRVSGGQLILSYRYTGKQIITRGASRPFSFSFDKPKNISQALRSVRSGIESKGGVFSGDESQGNFRASGISGQYSVADRVNVNIVEKPVIIPNSLIAKEVQNYFNPR
jgi:hypothetical protein